MQKLKFTEGVSLEEWSVKRKVLGLIAGPWHYQYPAP